VWSIWLCRSKLAHRSVNRLDEPLNTDEPQMIQVFDSWAGELSPSSFKTFALPYLNYIADNLPARLQSKGLEPVPMTVFAKGAWYALSDLCDTKYHTIGLDWLHDPAEAYKVARAKGKTLQGNADPGVLYGTHESITKVVENMVAGFGGGKQGWIANLGHGTCKYIIDLGKSLLTFSGITPFVKPDDLKFYFEEIHRLTSS
jgi:uroporphyrinogen decarboxylase